MTHWGTNANQAIAKLSNYYGLMLPGNEVTATRQVSGVDQRLTLIGFLLSLLSSFHSTSVSMRAYKHTHSQT